MPEVAESCCVKILAPASGTVLRILTESEQVVQSGTPILEIGDPRTLEIVVDLLSRDAVRVKAGTAAMITGWGGAADFRARSNGWSPRQRPGFRLWGSRNSASR